MVFFDKNLMGFETKYCLLILFVSMQWHLIIIYYWWVDSKLCDKIMPHVPDFFKVILYSNASFFWKLNNVYYGVAERLHIEVPSP